MSQSIEEFFAYFAKITEDRRANPREDIASVIANAKLRENPDFLPQAIDEATRWITPANPFMRTATEDDELRGKTIKKGESVVLMYASGNEEIFDESSRYRVDRRPNRHLAFGSGVHHCIGHLLVRIELKYSSVWPK